ncbi:pyrroline-5-carboxylate reductase [Microbacterium jejuense]|uniref:Pyrroline-5-carboxylate reductase n=1 Tax=Microbacterium jejuense TaxID=1263637 RepID=A0ABS7HHR4_9MICO|nr:pyrroline-5-carboxylate reductase [Microbacterium jejuense]MBW9092263.1 pyrroline-5-carboxylate reductase [Microbacterium jejuense]
MAEETPTLPPIAILGAGSMGGAIARGLSRSGLATAGVTATNRSREKAAELAGLEGVTSIALEERATGNTDAAAAADIVLVGVKPAMVPDLLREIAPVLRPGTLVVSLAAGVTIETFERILGDAAVLRSMPNTPALVGRGVTGLAAGSRADAGAVALVRRLFETVGTVIEVPEAQIDALSTISGSGPAYFFLVVEEFTKAAIGKGFAEHEARLMAEQTFVGAAALLEASDHDPAELRRQVTSPKGTTERAVAALQDAALDEVFARATDAALARAKELAAGA